MRTTARPAGPQAPRRRGPGHCTKSCPTMKTRAQKKPTPPLLSFTKRLPTPAPSARGLSRGPASSLKSPWIRKIRPTRGCAPATARRTAPWRRREETPRKEPWSAAWWSWSWRAWWRREASSPAVWAACRTPRWSACPSAPKRRPKSA